LIVVDRGCFDSYKFDYMDKSRAESRCMLA
jgi:hypothetical protein